MLTNYCRTYIAVNCPESEQECTLKSLLGCPAYKLCLLPKAMSLADHRRTRCTCCSAGPMGKEEPLPTESPLPTEAPLYTEAPPSPHAHAALLACGMEWELWQKYRVERTRHCHFKVVWAAYSLARHTALRHLCL
jgi:hypothetical protein